LIYVCRLNIETSRRRIKSRALAREEAWQEQTLFSLFLLDNAGLP